MSIKNGQTAIGELSDWVKKYASGGAIKQASEDASSSHASTSVDDGTQDATEGARSSENATDVQKQQPAQTPEEATVADASQHPSGGRTKHGNEPEASYCDEDQPSTKPKKDIPDAGTAGPTDQEKTSAAKLLVTAKSIMDKLAALSKETSTTEPAKQEAPKQDTVKQASAEPAKEAPKAEAKVETPADAEGQEAKTAALEAARLAGATAAQAIAEQLNLVQPAVMDKQAGADESDAELAYLQGIAKEAELHATRVHSYLSGFVKAAMNEMMPPPPAEEIPGAPAGVEAIPEAAAAEAGGEEQVSEEDLMLLAQLLEELGITPEELMAELANEGGGAAMPPEAGGMPPEAGGMPPEAAGIPPEAMAAEKTAALRVKKAKLVRALKSRIDKAAAALAVK